ncbi:MAG: PAS domain S-box protein [Ramlibacter sp.]
MQLSLPAGPIGPEALAHYDLLPAGVCLVRPDGGFIAANAAYCRYLGYSLAELTCMRVTDVTHPDDRERDTAARAELMRGVSQVYGVRKRYLHRDGSLLWVDLSVTPVAGADGRPVYTLAVVKDVSAVKLVEDELRRGESHLSALFAQSAAGVAESSIDGRLLSVNDRCCEITGRSREQLIGQRALDFTHPEDVARSDALRQQSVAQDCRVEMEKRYLRPDGSVVWVHVASGVVRPPEGGEPTLLAVLFDITESKRMEEALRSADRKKDEFLAMLAHELRNPLAPIGAAAALLKSGRLDSARTAQVSDVISRQVQHMTGLVNDLLDVSRVTRGIATLEMARVDACRIVDDAIDQVRPLMDARRHALHVEGLSGIATLLGDHKRLVQVLVNLLNNAAKFTREGGRIRLAMEACAGQLTWTVTDNGIGMDTTLVDRAFELFAQAERTADRSQGGLGIGLALVKSLVELHGGTVVARSAGPGHGSEFRVQLPLASQPAGSRAPRPQECPEQRPEKGLRLLVVDDNVDAATLLGMVLEDMGHEVIVEHDSHRALQRAVLARPQVCLLDIGLPEIDGNELARRLRALPETRDAVLIAVTGYGQDRDRELSAAAGFDHHFMKPVDPAELGAVLADVEQGVAA